MEVPGRNIHELAAEVQFLVHKVDMAGFIGCLRFLLSHRGVDTTVGSPLETMESAITDRACS